MAKVLIEHNQDRVAPEKIEHEPISRWTRLYAEHDALVNYLLLTCFDVLGQPDEWRDFPSWLRSQNTKSERDEAVAALTTSDPVEAASQLSKAHQSLYGIRRSFVRFIDEKLSESARCALLGSICLVRDGVEVDDPDAKKKFLYGLRNAFTHEAKARGQPARVFAPQHVTLRPTGLDFGCVEIDRDKKYTYGVRRWPWTLFETIAGFVGEPIPDFRAYFRVIADVDSTAVIMNRLSWAQLQDPQMLMDVARAFRASGNAMLTPLGNGIFAAPPLSRE